MGEGGSSIWGKGEDYLNQMTFEHRQEKQVGSFAYGKVSKGWSE